MPAHGAQGRPSRRARGRASLYRGPFTAPLVVALLVAGARSFAAEEIKWHATIAEAQEAAEATGKGVYIFMFAPADEASRTMRFTTLRSDKVIALLKQYECCAIDTTLRANRDIVEKYVWTESEDPDVKAKTGKIPVSLFTDAHGREDYIRWGYIPTPAFGEIIAQVGVLAAQKAILATKPDDPRASADLGHIMLALGLSPEIAKQHLQKAVDGDPENTVGACEDATLDLLILSIPDNPAKAFEALEAFLRRYPETKRALEVRYFKAVALVAQDDHDKWRQALELLQVFKTTDETRPEFSSSWARPALELEAQLRQALAAK